MRCLNIDLNLHMILVLFLSRTCSCSELIVPIIIKASSAEDGYKQCEHTVRHWASSSLNSEVKEDKHLLRDLLFFLHVPRTGGRTYFHCFLRKLYSSSQECPRSYDKLRVDSRKPNCRLLSTHDDYSIIYKLPKEKTSAVIILRNPVERVFSTFEFSVEVAARFLIHPNLTSVGRMARLPRPKKAGVSTLDIWPWKYLIPWMIEDLFARRDAREHRGQTYTMTNNSYDMEDILMPLHEFINEPIVRDIVHNGATFQIAGLTNNSHLAESHEVRHCVLKYPTFGKYVLEVAKKRLNDMLYVGLTENHKESASMFANVVGAQVISQLSTSRSKREIANNNDSEQSSSLPDSRMDANYQRNNTYTKVKKVSSIGKDEETNKNMTVGKLMEAYESCTSDLRNSQEERRANSLKNISPANFTKEARRHIPKVLLQKITSLNSLDMELYNYGQSIFAKQHERVMQTIVDTKRQETILIESAYINSYGSPSWKVLSLGTAGFSLLLFLFLSRRKTSKIKL
ncbi:protein-tyrosine sulfotransferase-like isoform X2 [Olea europaea var. sylvestris]|uniref:protein-tyrosine sulfotransferase-like isoform X2 n=1 Tax=Olea europaea var. sylvestris TaxID=158386 RepID=UPI000C1CCDDA|nr:protein-tyrosine sulfotransferase-like isoform X2 [Olea europaea var. sylvestris]